MNRTPLLLIVLLAGFCAPFATKNAYSLSSHRERVHTIRPDCPSLPALTSSDRLLILAPHEDDETLGAGGLISEAVSRRIPVRIVYLTYGDHNELAFLLYRKRLWITPKVNETMGEIRRQEAIRALGHLGVPEKNLVFLGYPDGDTLDIWKEHWGTHPPLRSRSTRTTRIPYPEAVSYNNPHKGEEIVADLEEEILHFRPTRIFVTEPTDGHPDHRSFYLFLEVALLNLMNRIAPPVVYTYPIHAGTWPHPYGFHPNDWLTMPNQFLQDGNPWRLYELTADKVYRKYEAIDLYKSQTVDSHYWLAAFARRNELFCELPWIGLNPEEWSPTSGVVERPETKVRDEEHPSHVSGVAYRQSPEGLMVQISLRRPIEPGIGISAYAFGYRKDYPFAAMPKIWITSIMGRIHVSDQGKAVADGDVEVKTERAQILVTIPWEMMGDPDGIFVQAQGIAGEIPISQTGWRLAIRNPKAMPRP